MGQEIKLTILTMGGEEVEIETPVDIVADELIKELCLSLHLPVTDAEGNPIKWRLDNKDTGQTLAGNESLEVEGVKEGHRLSLIRSTVAGGALVDALPSIGITKVNVNHQERRAVKTTNVITRFLWWCSGASANILKELPMEHVKYQAIGASILTDGMLAALSGGYSLYLVSNNLLLSILLGITWGVMIFNLTRYTVTSIRVRVKDEISRLPRIVGRVLHALPLLALSILIGLVISKPLEIALFRDVINQRMYSSNLENKDQLTKEIARTEATISALEYRLKAKDEEIVGLQNLYTSEIEGGQGSSGRPGAGPVFKEIQSRLFQAIKEQDQLNRETQEAIYKERIHLSELKAQEAILANNKETNGLLAQIVVLSRLTKENETIAKAQLLVMLLVLLVTAAPVMTKLLSQPGPYDALLERLGHKLPEEESLKIQKAFSEALDRSEFNPHK